MYAAGEVILMSHNKKSAELLVVTESRFTLDSEGSSMDTLCTIGDFDSSEDSYSMICLEPELANRILEVFRDLKKATGIEIL